MFRNIQQKYSARHLVPANRSAIIAASRVVRPLLVKGAQNANALSSQNWFRNYGLDKRFDIR